MSRRRRPLHPEEQELWHAVARTARPLHAKPVIPAAPESAALPAVVFEPPHPAPLPRLSAFRVGEQVRVKTGHDLTGPLAEAPLMMDAKAYGKLTRGKLLPEARIDLHGLTLAEAHPDLIRFILNAQEGGLRLVLVITGKGKRAPDHGPIPQRMGVLRHQVPHWLRQPPIGPAVLQVAEAHLKHGGAGAFYVYLRRNR